MNTSAVEQLLCSDWLGRVDQTSIDPMLKSIEVQRDVSLWMTVKSVRKKGRWRVLMLEKSSSSNFLNRIKVDQTFKAKKESVNPSLPFSPLQLSLSLSLLQANSHIRETSLWIPPHDWSLTPFETGGRFTISSPSLLTFMTSSCSPTSSRRWTSTQSFTLNEKIEIKRERVSVIRIERKGIEI